jgi:hypothetical protein
MRCYGCRTPIRFWENKTHLHLPLWIAAPHRGLFHWKCAISWLQSIQYQLEEIRERNKNVPPKEYTGK